MAVWRNTTYVEAVHYPEEGYKMDESGARRRCFINDGLQVRRQAAIDFCGCALIGTDSNGPGGTPREWVSRVTPHPYPVPKAKPTLPGGLGPPGGTPPSPDFVQSLYCTSIERTKPMGVTRAEVNAVATGGTQLLGKADIFAEMNLHYQTFRFPNVLQDNEVLATNPGLQVGTDNPLYNANPALCAPDEGDALRRGWQFTRYIGRSIKPGGRILQNRSGAFKFITDQSGTREPLNINEQMNDIVYTQFFVPYLAWPQQAIKNASCTVNGTVFDGWPIGTLLFLGSGAEEHKDVLGQHTYNISHHFRSVSRIRRNAGDPRMPQGEALGWNAIMRQYAGGAYDWEFISGDGTLTLNRMVFLSTDYGRLFRPDQTYANAFMS